MSPLHIPQRIEYVDPPAQLEDDELAIFKYIKRRFCCYTDPPMDVNYKTGLTFRPQPEETAVFGEIQIRKFWSESTLQQNGMYSYGGDLLAQEDITYLRDSAGFALSRDIVITWFMEDGTPHPETKTLHKAYDLAMRQQEGERRRSHLIQVLMMEVGGMLMATQQQSQQGALQMGRDFLDQYHQSKAMMVEASDQQILADVKNDTTHTWLDDEVPTLPGSGYTIRRYMFDQIDLWGVGWDNVT